MSQRPRPSLNCADVRRPLDIGGSRRHQQSCAAHDVVYAAARSTQREPEPVLVNKATHRISTDPVSGRQSTVLAGLARGAFGGAADDGRLDVGDAQADHVAGEEAVFRRVGDRPSRPRTSTAPAGFRPGRGCLRIDHAGIVVRGTSAGERPARARCQRAGWRHRPAASQATPTSTTTHHDAAGGLFTGSEGRVVGGD